MGSGASAGLADVEAIAVEVSKTEHEWCRFPVEDIAHLESLCGKRSVGGAGVGRDESNSRVDSRRKLVPGSDERERRATRRRCQFDPAEAPLQIRVHRGGEAHALEESLRPILIADGHGDALEPGEDFVCHVGGDRNANENSSRRLIDDRRTSWWAKSEILFGERVTEDRNLSLACLTVASGLFELTTLWLKQQIDADRNQLIEFMVALILTTAEITTAVERELTDAHQP